MRELKVTVIMASRWTVGGVGGVSGSSEDSDLEDEWVERWVINISIKSFLTPACLLPGAEIAEVLLSSASLGRSLGGLDLPSLRHSTGVYLIKPTPTVSILLIVMTKLQNPRRKAH